MNRRSVPPLIALAVLVACTAEPSRDVTSASATQPTGVTTAPASTGTDDPSTSATGTTAAGTGTSEAVTSGASDGSSGNVSGGAKFDLPVADLNTDTTGGTQTGCTKIDFLFVIDNSTSMEDNQKALTDSFPGFISGIKTALGDVTDYHVMVVDTDEASRCVTLCNTPNDPLYNKFCVEDNSYACKAVLEECDSIRGAGVIHPVGSHASNTKCQLFGGRRYMTSEEPDLESSFACVATVGTAGAPAEKPMNTIQAVVAPGLNAPMGCNEGFLREDAILVITFLSDDGKYIDKGTPEEWKASIVTAKGGDENAVVVLGLIPHPELNCTNPMGDMTQGSHWQEFIELWGDHGLSGSICETNYAPFFAQAIGAIDQTCDAFQPPG
jgi:hypothetical protein